MIAPDQHWLILPYIHGKTGVPFLAGAPLGSLMSEQLLELFRTIHGWPAPES